MVNIQTILQEALDSNASDIFLIAGHCYAFKINGNIENIGNE